MLVGAFVVVALLIGAHLHNLSKPPSSRKAVPGIKSYAERPQAEQTNIVFIKPHKCGTETLTPLFRRFGHLRNLSFVLPPNDCITLGWPYPLEERMYSPSKTGGFNILCEMSVLTLPFMTDIMPSDTMFVTTIREPFEQFKSAFNFFHLIKFVRTKGSDKISEYLRHLARYDDMFTAKGEFYVPPGRSITKNCMASTLGFPIGFLKGTKDQTKNTTAVKEWVNMLDKRLAFVIIVEYFDLSLVLLRHTLRWQIKDIIYVRRNTRSYKHKAQLFDEELLANHEAWSNVDYALYDHFNKTLWNKVAKQNGDFWDEVRHFDDVLNKTHIFCNGLAHDKRGTLHFPAHRWSPSFNVTFNDCRLFNSTMLGLIKRRYKNIPVVVEKRNRTRTPERGC